MVYAAAVKTVSKKG